MKSTWLVQRLQKPVCYANSKFAGLENVFSFGGGLKNGGLSDEAMKLFRDIFRFDYMGSAEYEFGAVPEAFQKIVKNLSDTVSFDIDVKYKCKDWKNKKELSETKKIYVICHKDWKEEVTNRINQWAKEDYTKTKEQIRLNSALAEHEYSKDIIGWLELDNGFIFFSDKEAFDKFKMLLELK